MIDGSDRVVCYDEDLKIEAFNFEGVMQKFPNHFHEYYVIGYIKSGTRKLIHQGKEYIIVKGDIVIFNPYDKHSCEQIDDKLLDWRCLNINEEIMAKLVEEVFGNGERITFNEPVIQDFDLCLILSDLHEMIMDKNSNFEKEELLLFLIEQLINNYSTINVNSEINLSENIKQVCDYMQENYNEIVKLDELAQIANLNKYILLRNFTKQLSITPYQYLSTIRINKAKKLLEDGISPLEVSILIGYSDQSHFSRFFKNFIGITPKSYQNLILNKKKEEMRSESNRK